MDWIETDREVLSSIRLLVSMVAPGVYDLRRGREIFNKVFGDIEEISLKDLVILSWALVFELADRRLNRREDSPIYG